MPLDFGAPSGMRSGGGGLVISERVDDMSADDHEIPYLRVCGDQVFPYLLDQRFP
jgi:hypothetical protein